jgi:hypothetical protein
MKRETNIPHGGHADYPHVISSIGGRRHCRWRVLISNNPVEDPNDGTWIISGIRSVGPGGQLTEQGRQNLIRQIGERARTSKAHYCIVWGDTDCSFFLPDGSIRQGHNPPQGDLVADEDAWDATPILCEPVWSIALTGRGPPYLCIKRTGDLVEVMAGARIVLADFSDYPAGCDNDPAANLRDKQGRWKRPLVHRRQRVEAITEQGLLLGPVQPLEMGATVILRQPWPHQIEAACNQIAGRRLPNPILQAVWAALDPAENLRIVDVLDAA